MIGAEVALAVGQRPLQQRDHLGPPPGREVRRGQAGPGGQGLQVTGRTAVELPAAALSQYVGVYELAPGQEVEITMRDGALYIRSSLGGAALRFWPESNNEFFVNEADAQVTFSRNASGAVTGLVLHQYGRDRPAKKVR